MAMGNINATLCSVLQWASFCLLSLSLSLSGLFERLETRLSVALSWLETHTEMVTDRLLHYSICSPLSLSLSLSFSFIFISILCYLFRQHKQLFFLLLFLYSLLDKEGWNRKDIPERASL